MKESFRLITNLDFVDVEVNGSNMRLWCHALLIECVSGFSRDELQYRVRAFGTDAAWPVFTHWFKCDSVEYEMRDAQDDSVIVMGDASPDGKRLLTEKVRWTWKTSPNAPMPGEFSKPKSEVTGKHRTFPSWNTSQGRRQQWTKQANCSRPRRPSGFLGGFLLLKTGSNISNYRRYSYFIKKRLRFCCNTSKSPNSPTGKIVLEGELLFTILRRCGII
jgi:hypothetical protein